MLNFVDINFIIFIVFALLATYFLILPIYRLYKKEKNILVLEEDYSNKLNERKNLIVK